MIDWRAVRRFHNQGYGCEYETCEELLRGLYCEPPEGLGMPMRKVAVRLGVAELTLRAKLAELNIPVYKKGRFYIRYKALGQETISKMTVTEIADTLSCSIDTVYNLVRKTGWQYKQEPYVGIVTEQFLAIPEDEMSKMTAKKLAEVVRTSTQYIYVLAEKYDRRINAYMS